MVLFLERRRGGMVFSSRGVGVVWFSSSRDVGGGMVLFLERCWYSLVSLPREMLKHGMVLGSSRDVGSV